LRLLIGVIPGVVETTGRCGGIGARRNFTDNAAVLVVRPDGQADPNGTLCLITPS